MSLRQFAEVGGPTPYYRINTADAFCFISVSRAALSTCTLSCQRPIHVPSIVDLPSHLRLYCQKCAPTIIERCERPSQLKLALLPGEKYPNACLSSNDLAVMIQTSRRMNALCRVSLRRILFAIFQKEYGRLPVHYAGRVFWKPLGAVFGPHVSKDTTNYHTA